MAVDQPAADLVQGKMTVQQVMEDPAAAVPAVAERLVVLVIHHL